jgi:hypothetical protein
MKTLWNEHARDEICRRVDRLTPDASARWGRFNVAQMLAHLNDAMRMALGELPVAPKRMPIRYWPLKQLIVYALPFPHGAPTAPELLTRCDHAAFADERAAFRGIVARLVAKPQSDDWPEHPAFGRLSYRAWGVLGYRHADHHLRQFGV